MKQLLILISLVLSTSAFASYKTIKLDEETGLLVKALADKNVNKNLVSVLNSGNTISDITAEVNTSKRNGSEVVYTISNRHCGLAPGGPRCLGGSVLVVTANEFYIPGGVKTTFSSKVLNIK